MSANLLANPEHREEWLAARRQGIGASEIAAVLGISPWESPFSLYWRKIHGWEIDVTDEMRAGLLLEPAIAEWFTTECDPHENLHVTDGGLYAHRDRPWQLATPDRLIRQPCPRCDGDGDVPLGFTGESDTCPDCGGWGHGEVDAVLELKFVAHSWDGWGEAGTDDIPVHYRAQVLWQCDVMGVGEWFLAALGPGGFRSYRGHIDEKDLRVMRAAGQRFMDRIAANDPPPLDDHSATLVAVKRLHPDLTDDVAEVAAETAALYRRACQLVRSAERLKASAEAKLRTAMGSARRAEHDGAFVASRSIYGVAESVRKAYIVDRLNPARERKSA